jgi:hypothetical protein
MMRISRSLIFAAALFSPAALAVGAPRQKQPFTLTLEAPKLPVKAGKPIILRVKVTNTSDQAVSIPISEENPFATMVGQIYRVHALDQRGRPAPPWVRPPPPKGKTVLPIGSAKSVGLQPGESLTDQVNITYLYDLSRPGKYRVWIAEPFYRGAHLRNGLVRSNTITVTVVK